MADADYTDEIWKTIPFAPDYAASSYGRVRRDVPDKCGREPRVLKLSCPGRYAKVGLYIDGRLVHQSVHRCVAWAFHGEPDAGHHAAHIDGDRSNNRPENLKWCTAKENIADKLLHGTMSQGEAHPCAKLSTDEVLDIRRRYEAGEKIAPMAREKGMDASTISAIVHRDKWKSIA